MTNKPPFSFKLMEGDGLIGKPSRTPEEKKEETLRQIGYTVQELRDISHDLDLTFLAYLLDMASEEARRCLMRDAESEN